MHNDKNKEFDVNKDKDIDKDVDDKQEQGQEWWLRRLSLVETFIAWVDKNDLRAQKQGNKEEWEW